jgi:hypothetical protein
MKDTKAATRDQAAQPATVLVDAEALAEVDRIPGPVFAAKGLHDEQDIAFADCADPDEQRWVNDAAAILRSCC